MSTYDTFYIISYLYMCMATHFPLRLSMKQKNRLPSKFPQLRLYQLNKKKTYGKKHIFYTDYLPL